MDKMGIFEEEYNDCEDDNSMEENKREKNECGKIKIYARCVHIHVNCREHRMVTRK